MYVLFQQRHSQPEFERLRTFSDANSELSYDIFTDKPFKSTNDIRALQSHHPSECEQNVKGIYHQQQPSRHSQSSEFESNGIVSNEIHGSNGRSLVAGNKRNLPKHQRPLTRYLPIMSVDLDLRHHIESAGHQVALCPHVFLDATSCRG